MTILLVENNADHRELMRLVLTGHDPAWQLDRMVSGEETLRRRADEVLKISGERYRDLVDNALIGIYQSSPDGTILFANDSLMRMLECSSLEDLASEKVFSFHRDARDCELFINLLKAGAKLLPFTAEMVTKTGAVKTVLLSAALDGELLSGMVLDITEGRQ